MTVPSADAPPRGVLPEPVQRTLDDFRAALGLSLALWLLDGDHRLDRLYPLPGTLPEPMGGASVLRRLSPRDGPELELEVRGADAARLAPLSEAVGGALERLLDLGQEIRFFTHELAERYEEINLLYSISETLGSVLRLDDAARAILHEVCDVLGARRGSLWVFDAERGQLRLTASVGALVGPSPLDIDDPVSVTARVFREGRPLITAREAGGDTPDAGDGDGESFLSVPIGYTPPAGEPRIVGVINLIGRGNEGRFTASDQKLLSAIASQIGAALENNRLIQESLAQERVAREMELAHDLQMKLLPAVETFDGADVAAQVRPADSVGGDFYHLFKLSADRFGVMIGDVSGHGFPAALIMALSMSAATIYASEFGNPSKVLRHLDDALRDELESTEMYLTLFYAVIDPQDGKLVYSNAGHPHAFVMHPDGTHERLDATDPPVGIAGETAYGERQIEWCARQDLLVLFTDGLSGTLLPDGAGERGEQIVLAEVAAKRELRAAEIVEALFGLAGASEPNTPPDDRTAIVLRA